MKDDTFLLDANIFIEAHRRYYGFDVCPGFWESLGHFAMGGRIISIDRVYSELKVGQDSLWDWARPIAELFVPSTEPQVVQAFSEVIQWVKREPQFRPEAKSEFATKADGWIAAYAQVHGTVIVTHEGHDPNVKKRVPLGNVCREFKLPVMDTFTMLRKLQIRFDWKT